jgi:hypothetical protein
VPAPSPGVSAAGGWSPSTGGSPDERVGDRGLARARCGLRRSLPGLCRRWTSSS